MNDHLTEDILLKVVLESLEPDELQDVNRHLKKCPECTASLLQMQKEVAGLGKVEVPVEIPDLPLPKAQQIKMTPWLKAAAILIIGFAGGYGTAELLKSDQVYVKPQTIQVESPVVKPGSFITCQEIDTHYSEEAI